ncbi:hypothetical protein [Clavibacter zhangzhiyongii]|uniref:hypothetical protein n=1 Tax=Clavibacter zhangzhiyongii TaxID=2768071 RepID=UPI0039E0FCA4
MSDEPQLLSMPRAAQRVRRTERAIQRWINEDGMRFVWKGGRKMIRLDDLLLHYRSNLKANPARQRLHPIEANPMRGVSAGSRS